MFKHEKKREKKQPETEIISLFDKEGNLLLSCPLNNFPFSEDIILLYSQEFFSDPEPCAIHRRAVALRLIAEIQGAVEKGAKTEFSSLTKELTDMLGHGAAFVMLTQC